MASGPTYMQRAKRAASLLNPFAHYHATRDTGKRQAPQSTIRSEDEELKWYDRKKLVATAIDQRRNAALLAWMVNTHLDYVTRHQFQARSSDPEWNKRAEYLMRWWSQPSKCDIAERHSLQSMIRLLEGHAVVDGDAALLQVQGGRLQGIEGSRIASDGMSGVDYGGRNKDEVDHGLHYDPSTGKVKEYCIGYRHLSQLKFDGWRPADNVIFHGYFNRFDQRRGVSPLSSAINTIADLYEGMDAMLIKTKMHAFLGIAIMEDDGLPGWEYDDDSTGATATSATDPIDLSFEMRTGLKLGLRKDSKVDMLESKSPHQAYISWTELCIQVALLALNIPFTWFDARKSSFSASMLDVQKYDQSVKEPRARIQNVLNAVTAWKLGQWMSMPDTETGQPMLGKPAGMESMSTNIILASSPWEWQPSGMPWIQYLQERRGDTLALATGQGSPYKLAARRGEDAEDILRDLIRWFKFGAEEAERQGVNLPMYELLKAGASGIMSVTEPPEEDPENAD